MIKLTRKQKKTVKKLVNNWVNHPIIYKKYVQYYPREGEVSYCPNVTFTGNYWVTSTKSGCSVKLPYQPGKTYISKKGVIVSKIY